MNLNKVILCGRLTRDPELRQTTSGQAVATVGLATSRTWIDKAGQKQEGTEWHTLVVWGRQGEIVNQYSRKGDLLLVEGRLQTREWEDKDKNKRKTTEVVVEQVQFGPKRQGSAPARDDFDGPEPGEPIIDLGEDTTGEEINF